MGLSIGMVTIDCSDPRPLAEFSDRDAGHHDGRRLRRLLADPEGNEFCVGSHHG